MYSTCPPGSCLFTYIQIFPSPIYNNWNTYVFCSHADAHGRTKKQNEREDLGMDGCTYSTPFTTVIRQLEYCNHTKKAMEVMYTTYLADGIHNTTCHGVSWCQTPTLGSIYREEKKKTDKRITPRWVIKSNHC